MHFHLFTKMRIFLYTTFTTLAQREQLFLSTTTLVVFICSVSSDFLFMSTMKNSHHLLPLKCSFNPLPYLISKSMILIYRVTVSYFQTVCFWQHIRTNTQMWCQTKTFWGQRSMPGVYSQHILPWAAAAVVLLKSAYFPKCTNDK